MTMNRGDTCKQSRKQAAVSGCCCPFCLASKQVVLTLLCTGKEASLSVLSSFCIGTLFYKLFLPWFLESIMRFTAFLVVGFIAACAPSAYAQLDVKFTLDTSSFYTLCSGATVIQYPPDLNV
jgi:hypothetical protein